MTLFKILLQPEWAPQARGPLFFAHAEQSIATPLPMTLDSGDIRFVRIFAGVRKISLRQHGVLVTIIPHRNLAFIAT